MIGSRVGQKRRMRRKTRRPNSSAMTAAPPIRSGALAASESRWIVFFRPTLPSSSKFVAVLLCAAVPPFVESRARVRYAETDQMGVVYHANYFVWMEVGRVELVRSLGLNYHDLEKTEGLCLSVIEASCRYLAPARYDQQIAIETRVNKANERTVEFGYRILSLDPDRLLVEGTTRHMWLNREWRPTRLPARYLSKFESGAGVSA